MKSAELFDLNRYQKESGRFWNERKMVQVLSQQKFQSESIERLSITRNSMRHYWPIQ